MRHVLLLCAVLAGCGDKASSSSETPAPAAAPAPPPAASRPAPPPVVLKARAGGPTVEACQRAADHLADMIAQATAPSGITAEEQAYVQTMLKGERDSVVRYCLEVAAVKEIDCVATAKDIGGLGGCERLRREVPEEVLAHREVTAADCERFFDRLRQFKIAEGATPAEVDKTRDQIIRTCQEKARPGTLACFLASPDYAHARQCP